MLIILIPVIGLIPTPLNVVVWAGWRVDENMEESGGEHGQ